VLLAAAEVVVAHHLLLEKLPEQAELVAVVMAQLAELQRLAVQTQEVVVAVLDHLILLVAQVALVVLV
jgi:hypothetical protein